MTVYHVPTVYLIVGFLYLLLPVVIWLTLEHRYSETARLWCWGGCLLAAGLILVGLRGNISPWMSYPLANAFAWSGTLLQARALRHALQKSWSPKILVFVVVVWLSVFEYYRLIEKNATWRFVWAMFFYVGVFGYIAYLARHIARSSGLRSGYWLAAVYALSALIIVARAVRVLLGWSNPDAVAEGIDSTLTIVSGLLLSVIGSFAFISIFLERATKLEIEATAQRVLQEENTRLAGQIAQLDRQRTLGAMSASFAHELSQPLTAILMDAQAIKMGTHAGDMSLADVRQLVEGIEANTTRTVNLVSRIRDFIRPTQQHYAPIDLSQVLADVAQLLAHDMAAEHVVLHQEIEAGECSVYGDRIQISQIILNVYRNAMQAMQGQRTKDIFVTLAREGHAVVLRIQDTGPGLTESIKLTVGQPFVTSKEDGLGLGLSISRAIAEMHGGRLTITNAVGGGALVELNLPEALQV